MTKQIFLFLTIFGVSSPAFSQNLQLIDSLKFELKNAESQRRFDLLNDLAWEYRWAYPDSTIHYAKQASALGGVLNLQKSLAEPMNFIGVAHNYKGNRLMAFEHYDQALTISTDQRDSLQIAHSNNNLGRLFFEQGLLSRSYTYFIKALSIFEAINDPTGLAYTYQSLANLYKMQRDYTKAENNYLRANKIRLDLRNTRDIMSAYLQTARLYEEIKQGEKALMYFQKADSAGMVINDEINLAEIKTFIADHYLNEDSLEKAESMCLEGLRVIQAKNIVRMLPHAFLTLGQIKLQKRDFASAREYFTQALSISSVTNDLAPKMRSYYQLWKLSEKSKDRAGELENMNHYLVLRDSVKDLDLARQVERLQFEIEIERKERENELLKVNQAKTAVTVERQRLQNIILIVIVGFVSILGFVQWRNTNWRTIYRTTGTLSENKTRLRKKAHLLCCACPTRSTYCPSTPLVDLSRASPLNLFDQPDKVVK